MKKKTLSLILIILFNINNFAYADTHSSGVIIQKQSKQIKDLQNRVTELEKSFATLKYNIERKNQTYDSTIDSTDTTTMGEGSLTQEAINHPENFHTTPTEQPLNEKEKYDLALAALKNKNFDSAEQQFADFITTYPTSTLSSNATFWYAESFFRRNDFNNAAIHYLQSYKNFPQGTKAPDALLKLAISLSHLQKTQEACNILTKLEKEFPKRHLISIKRAQEARNKFQCPSNH